MSSAENTIGDLEQLSALARLGDDWYWETDRESRFAYFSAETSRSNWRLADWIGRNIRDCFGAGPCSGTRLVELEATIARREAFRDVVFPIDGPTGERTEPVRWLSISGAPNHDATGTFVGYSGIGRDVTAAQTRETELQRLAAVMDAVFSTFPGGLVLFDDDLRLVACNDRYAPMVGVDAANVRAGVSMRDLIIELATAGEFGPCEDPEKIADVGMAALAANPSVYVEHMRPNGRAYEMHRSPVPGGGSLVVYLDITKRRRAQKRLQDLNTSLETVVKDRTSALTESERSHRTLIANIPGMVYRRTYEPPHSLLFVSDGCHALLGHPSEMLLKERAHFGDFIHPDDRDRVWQQVRADFLSEKAFEMEYRIRHADGSWRWVLDRAQPLRTNDGGIVLLEGLILDIHDRKMAEAERKASEERLRQSQKMEAVGQLTGGIAHDFNNILMVILANADALQEEKGLGAGVVAHLDQIAKAVERASGLTRSLLAYSRKQPLTPQTIDINELISATSNLLRRSLGEHIKIESTLADNLWPVNVDRAQLETALINLCVNARDAMPNGGQLRIGTHNVALSDHEFVPDGEEARGDYVRINVRDTGSGMPPDVVAKVFEPFFTTKSIGKGTGLGLAMVYGFVKQSGGHVRVQSEIGKGTSFDLYLPRGGGDDMKTAVSEPVPLIGGGERILVVEDEPGVRATVVQSLQSLGYTVSDVPGGAGAVTLLEAAALPFDLLLTDVVMPGRLNGTNLADVVMRRWPATRVVFMSGYPENAVSDQGPLNTELLLLNKPFHKSDLARIVRQALGRADDRTSAAGLPG